MSSFFGIHGSNTNIVTSSKTEKNRILKSNSKLLSRGFYTRANAEYFANHGLCREEHENLLEVKEMVERGEVAHVYTDGASSPQKVGKKIITFAGAGIYWKNNRLPEQSLKVDDNKPDGKKVRTSQRAELHAVIVALNTAAKELQARKLLISTDSEYVIKCISNRQKYHSYHFLTKTGTDMPNKDLLKKLYTAAQNVKPFAIHVKGHSGDHGNTQADRLAVSARKAWQEEVNLNYASGQQI